jgi:hypothetical protein
MYLFEDRISQGIHQRVMGPFHKTFLLAHLLKYPEMSLIIRLNLPLVNNKCLTSSDGHRKNNTKPQVFPTQSSFYVCGDEISYSNSHGTNKLSWLLILQLNPTNEPGQNLLSNLWIIQGKIWPIFIGPENYALKRKKQSFKADNESSSNSIGSEVGTKIFYSSLLFASKLQTHLTWVFLIIIRMCTTGNIMAKTSPCVRENITSFMAFYSSVPFPAQHV